MIRSSVAALCALTAALAIACLAGADEIPSSPTRWVTDATGFISETTRAQLDAKLETYERSTGHQVLVWIGDTTGDVPLEDWTIKTFTKWRVGRKNLDDGIALFIFAKDHKLRIEVGYGLEGQVPDVIASRIIREAIVPRIKAGDPDGAVSAGVDQIIAAIGGKPLAAAPQTSAAGSSVNALLAPILFAAIWIVFMLVIVRSRRYAGWAAYTIGSGSSSWGGFGGGGGGGGGGFSGGGGMGGGGGASGGW